MLPVVIASIMPFLFEVCSSIAAEVGKKKTLSFIEEQGEPIINQHLARALIRALAGSLIAQLNAWCETSEGKQNKEYASFAIKQLQVLLDETKEKNEDWIPFISNEKLNNSSLNSIEKSKKETQEATEKFNNSVLNPAMEAIRTKRTMQFSDLGKKAMENLKGYFIDPEQNQKTFVNFSNFLGKDNEAAFNRDLYERFREEIKGDPVTFNAFTIDFMEKIYADVKEALPNADALADTVSSIAERHDKLEGTIITIPEKTAKLLSSIQITKEEHTKSLQELSKKMDNLYRSSSVTGEQGEQILKKLTEIQFALSTPQGLEESYRARIKQLEEQIAQLQALKGAFPEKLLDEAIIAIRQGNDQKALAVFQEVDKLSESSIAVAAESKFQQGLIAEHKVQYGAALELFLRASELVPNNTRYLIVVGNLYGFLGVYDKAIRYHEKALAIRQDVLPPNHLDIAVSLDSLGNAWQGKGDYAKAIEYYEQALAIRRAVLPPNHPEIAGYRNNIGTVWNCMGDYDKAIGHYEKALAIFQAVLPPNHPDIARTLDNLGNAWQGKGDYDKAIGYYEQALAILQTVLPPNHPDIAMSLNSLGNKWQAKGDRKKADYYHEKAYAINPVLRPAECQSNIKRPSSWMHKLFRR